MEAISSEVDLGKIRQLKGFKEKKYANAVYYGLTFKERRHGKGIMKYGYGRQYEGDWLHDLRHGKGFERYPNGNSYYGHFV